MQNSLRTLYRWLQCKTFLVTFFKFRHKRWLLWKKNIQIVINQHFSYFLDSAQRLDSSLGLDVENVT